MITHFFSHPTFCFSKCIYGISTSRFNDSRGFSKYHLDQIKREQNKRMVVIINHGGRMELVESAYYFLKEIEGRLEKVCWGG